MQLRYIGALLTIKLIAGLGNPGPEYESTRHNAGFRTLDKLAEELGARYWKTECGALVAHVKHKGEEVLLAKPQAYMNTSVGPISKLAARYGVEPKEILVIHDDLDLEPGTLRVKVGGGHGGHNGLKSIHAKLGSNEYLRVKIGIGHPPGRKPVVDYVLQAPKGEEAEILAVAENTAADAALCVMDKGPAKAMNAYN